MIAKGSEALFGQKPGFLDETVMHSEIGLCIDTLTLLPI
jgi:hypothetical protein